MGRRDNFVSVILCFLILLIFSVTIYFCLDIFGIINVPENLSLAKFFGTTITDISVAIPMEEQITEETIDDWINQKIDEYVEQSEPVEENDTGNFIIPDFSVLTNTTTNNNQVSNVPNFNKDNVVNRMYYSQLDLYGKVIYNEFADNKELLKTGTYTADFGNSFNELLHKDDGAEILERAFQFSLNAFLFDNPDVFYIDVTKMYMSTEIISFGPLKTYKIKIGALDGENYLSNFFHNEDVVTLAQNGLERIKSDVLSNLRGNTYDCIKQIHDYIIKNAEYDQTLSKDNIYNTYGALVGHTAVCEGYAKSLKYLLDEVGIPCVIVCGIAQNSNGQTESHAWNYVKIDDSWYAIDLTWDDPVIVGNGYISESIYSRYFLKGSKDFFVDHLEDGNIVEGSSFVYPTLSEENYEF